MYYVTHEGCTGSSKGKLKKKSIPLPPAVKITSKFVSLLVSVSLVLFVYAGK